MATEDTLNSTNTSNQRQTILNLYNSGIEKDIISYQLDISKEEVDKIIEEEEKQKRQLLILSSSEKQMSDAILTSIGSSFYLDAIVNIDLAIRKAQTRMWKALKSEPHFDISMEETDTILQKLSKSKVTFVILHIDLVGSTHLSMTLPLDRLTTIIQTFSQEMSLVTELYGGYVLKYVGDAVLAFFVTNPNNGGDNEDRDDSLLQKQYQYRYYLPCINAINCARSMIKVVKEGINPILNQSDYPDIGVRIGIDVGEIAIIQYGWDIHTLDKKQLIVKEPHYDILGHTINVAVKMTGLAKPNSFTIGQSVYDILDEKQKSTFETLNVNPNTWSYLNEKTGSIYQVYNSTA
jgi:class 3 adenylate cyclase